METLSLICICLEINAIRLWNGWVNTFGNFFSRSFICVFNNAGLFKNLIKYKKIYHSFSYLIIQSHKQNKHQKTNHRRRSSGEIQYNHNRNLIHVGKWKPIHNAIYNATGANRKLSRKLSLRPPTTVFSESSEKQDHVPDMTSDSKTNLEISLQENTLLGHHVTCECGRSVFVPCLAANLGRGKKTLRFTSPYYGKLTFLIWL